MTSGPAIEKPERWHRRTDTVEELGLEPGRAAGQTGVQRMCPISFVANQMSEERHASGCNGIPHYRFAEAVDLDQHKSGAVVGIDGSW
jgi:hypothetical protein